MHSQRRATVATPLSSHLRAWYRGASELLSKDSRLLLRLRALRLEPLEKRELLAEWFVAPGGMASNPGTIDAPWDVQSALVNTTDVRPGDTIWLRGGIYDHADRSAESDGYQLNLQGTAEAPITVRAYPSERATIDGGMKTFGTPRHVRIQDLEVIVSENFTRSRVSHQSGSRPTDLNRPTGGIHVTSGHDIKLINNVVHGNTGSGIGFWKEVGGDSELYGNIIYDNGWIGPDRQHGHGIYSQNASADWKYIRHNILHDNYSFNLHAYGSSSAPIDRYYVDGNISYGGSVTDDGRLLIGGAQPSQTIRVLDNLNYRSDLLVGWRDGGDDAVVEGNTLLRSRLDLCEFTNLAVADNYQWQSDDPIPTGPLVFLDPNAYDPDRAHLAVMDFRNSAQTPVDFASFLQPGERFRLMEPTDFFGAPVFSGTYTGEPVMIPLSGEFTVYVVLRGPTAAEVIGRHVFYNQSIFDHYGLSADWRDDDAIAPDKTALLPGHAATFANYTSYSRGINGIMVDVMGLADPDHLGAADFVFRVGNDARPSTWAAAPAPREITVRRGQGAFGSDRVTIVWEDGAIRNQWLRVSIEATADTGLPEADVFYFGNAVGEVGNSATDARVNAVDVLLTRDNPCTLSNPAYVDLRYDHNRDGRVNSTDLLIARNNRTHFLNALSLWTPMPAVMITEVASGDDRFVEIQNLSGRTVDTSGWTVAVNDAAAGRIDAVAEMLWQLPRTWRASRWPIARITRTMRHHPGSSLRPGRPPTTAGR